MDESLYRAGKRHLTSNQHTTSFIILSQVHNYCIIIRSKPAMSSMQWQFDEQSLRTSSAQVSLDRLHAGTHADVLQRNCSRDTMALQTARQTWNGRQPNSCGIQGRRRRRWYACHFSIRLLHRASTRNYDPSRHSNNLLLVAGHKSNRLETALPKWPMCTCSIQEMSAGKV